MQIRIESVWHRVECKCAHQYRETLRLDHIHGRGNLLPQGEIESLVIEFLDLGLGRVVQSELSSIYFS
jgi:hypothetical protein